MNTNAAPRRSAARFFIRFHRADERCVAARRQRHARSLRTFFGRARFRPTSFCLFVPFGAFAHEHPCCAVVFFVFTGVLGPPINAVSPSADSATL